MIRALIPILVFMVASLCQAQESTVLANLIARILFPIHQDPAVDACSDADLFKGVTCEKPGYGVGQYQLERGMEKADPTWPVDSLKELPAKVWNLPQLRYGTPAYQAEFFKRYGLNFAENPEENNGLPLGFLQTQKNYLPQKKSSLSLVASPGSTSGKGKPGITFACTACHESRVFGKVYPAGNPFFNFERLTGDLNKTVGRGALYPLPMNPSLSNSIVNAADHIGMLDIFFRRTDETPTPFGIGEAALYVDEKSGLLQKQAANVAYLKTPPWFTFKTKMQTDGKIGLYYDGLAPKDFNFAAKTYEMTFSKSSTNDLLTSLREWNVCARAALLTEEAPPYPFKIDQSRARKGMQIFEHRCAECHGNYSWPGASGRPVMDSYLGPRIGVDVVGTDPLRANLSQKFGLNFSRRDGGTPSFQQPSAYVPPPLTSIWIRAPYLHNGSVPNLRELLFAPPDQRDRRFVLDANPNNPDDYDQTDLGWKVRSLKPGEVPGTFDRVYDTTAGPGLSNSGHPFGKVIDNASDQADLLEFLKAL